MFCERCGKELTDGKKCYCRLERRVSNLLWRMGVNMPSENSANLMESRQRIVPDIIRANDGEVPVKQYEVATLRSRIRGQYAKGRLQVTNKRLLFRAAGISYQGALAQQYEFDVAEIAGIEIKKANRFSLFNFFLCSMLNLLVGGIFLALFSAFAKSAEGFAIFTSLVVGAGAACLFFMAYRKFWLKLTALCCATGALLGAGELASNGVFFLFLGLHANIADIVNLVVFLLWFLNVLLVCLVPDLVLVVKTKGGGEAFTVRRKQFPTPFRQVADYTGFGEVLPGKDIDAAIAELGAIIDDIQTMGDMAIEKWT